MAGTQSDGKGGGRHDQGWSSRGCACGRVGHRDGSTTVTTSMSPSSIWSPNGRGSRGTHSSSPESWRRPPWSPHTAPEQRVSSTGCAPVDTMSPTTRSASGSADYGRWSPRPSPRATSRPSTTTADSPVRASSPNGAPGLVGLDQLGLVGTVDRLGQSVVIQLPTAPTGG